jgi:tRNA G26 N,N-dimethylase Trm1
MNEVFVKTTRPATIFEGFGGCGASGVRYATLATHTVINDWSPTGIMYIKKNLEINGLTQKSEVWQLDVEKLMLNQAYNGASYDLIDIDPYDTPNYLLDLCFKIKTRYLIINNGDYNVYYGRSQRMVNIAMSRYGTALSFYVPDLMIRRTIYQINEVAGLNDKGAIPMFFHTHIHGLRYYFKIEDEPIKFSAVSHLFGYCVVCSGCHLYKYYQLYEFDIDLAARQWTCPCLNRKLRSYGPVWIGELVDPAFMREASKHADPWVKPLLDNPHWYSREAVFL